VRGVGKVGVNRHQRWTNSIYGHAAEVENDCISETESLEFIAPRPTSALNWKLSSSGDQGPQGILDLRAGGVVNISDEAGNLCEDGWQQDYVRELS
jgi:hypothetical protein